MPDPRYSLLFYDLLLACNLQDFMNDVRKIVQKEVPTALPSVIGFATRLV